MIVHTDHHAGNLKEFGDSTWLPSESDTDVKPKTKLVGKERLAAVEFLNGFRSDSLERAGWMSLKADIDKSERLGLIFDLMTDMADEIDVVGQEDTVTVSSGALPIKWPETYHDGMDNEVAELRIGEYCARRDNFGGWWIGASEFGVKLVNDDEFWDNFGQLCEKLLDCQADVDLGFEPHAQIGVSVAA